MRTLRLLRKRKGKLYIFNLCMFIIVVVMAVAMFYFRGLPRDLTAADPVTGNTQANFANRGLVITYSDWVYYADPSSNYVIKRYSETDGHVEIMNKLNGMFLSADNDYLYYVDYMTRRLMRSRLSGSELAYLSDETVSFTLQLKDKLLYASLDGGIFEIRKDGTKRHPLSTVRTTQFIIRNGRLYYGDLDADNTAGSMERETGSGAEHYQWKLGQNAVECDGYIYYINTQGDYKVYSMDLTDPSNPSITDSGIGIATGLTAEDNKLYYIKPENGGRLFLRQGGINTKLTSFPVYSPQIIGKWIYVCRADEDGAIYRINKYTGETMKLP